MKEGGRPKEERGGYAGGRVADVRQCGGWRRREVREKAEKWKGREVSHKGWTDTERIDARDCFNCQSRGLECITER